MLRILSGRIMPMWRLVIASRFAYSTRSDSKMISGKSLIYKLSLFPNDRRIGKEFYTVCEQISSLDSVFADTKSLYNIVKVIAGAEINCKNLWSKISKALLAIDCKAYPNRDHLTHMGYIIYNENVSFVTDLEKKKVETFWEYVPLSDLQKIDPSMLSYLANISQNPEKVNEQYTKFSNELILEITRRKKLTLEFYLTALNFRADRKNPVNQFLCQEFVKLFANDTFDSKLHNVSKKIFYKMLHESEHADDAIRHKLSIVVKSNVQSYKFHKSDKSCALAFSRLVSRSSVCCLQKEDILAAALEKLKLSPHVWNFLPDQDVCDLITALAPVLVFPRDDSFMASILPHLTRALPHIPHEAVLRTALALKSAKYTNPQLWTTLENLTRNVPPLSNKQASSTIFSSPSLPQDLASLLRKVEPEELVQACKQALLAAGSSRDVVKRALHEYAASRFPVGGSEGLPGLVRFAKLIDREFHWLGRSRRRRHMFGP